MFRTINERILSSSTPRFFLKNGIIQEAFKKPFEINTVKLMGTIEHKVKRLKNGSIKLFLKTINEDTSYCIHKVAIANSNLLNMVGNQLAVNQRIYIGGKIKTENISIENQRHQDVEILANELYFLESNPIITEDSVKQLNEIQPNQSDQNCIEMLAFIGSTVVTERNIGAFLLITHFTTRKGQQNESTSHEYHRVFIYNNREMLRIAYNLRKHDRVYVNGLINYITKEYPDGKNYTNGFIQPTNLVRLKKFD